MNTDIFCIAPMPILWKAVYWLIPGLALVGFFLFLLMGICVWYGKKKGHKIFNEKMKTYLLWFLVVMFSLFVYGLIGLSFEMYLVEYIAVTIFSLLAIYFGRKFRWFEVSSLFWKVLLLLAFVFVSLFAYRWSDKIFFSDKNADNFSVPCAYFLIF